MEYTTLVRHYYNERWYNVSQIFLNLSLLSKNIASIVVTAQVMDEVIVFVSGRSCALQLFPFQFVWTTHRGMPVLHSSLSLSPSAYMMSDV